MPSEEPQNSCEKMLPKNGILLYWKSFKHIGVNFMNFGAHQLFETKVKRTMNYMLKKSFLVKSNNT